MIVDFTHTIDNGITSYTENTNPKIEQIATIDKDYYEERSINIFTHKGTHIDSPRHMLKKGKYIDEYELDDLMGSAIILDFSNMKEVEITKENLFLYNEEIRKVEFVLIKTGAEKYWCTDEYLKNYKTLTIEAAQYLSSFKLKGVGVDCISIGQNHDEITIHKIFLEKEILIIENLSLKECIKGVFKLIIAPLKVKNSDGVPVRAFGLI